MEPLLMKQLNMNSLNFKRALDRIEEKYSKLQYRDDELEVDISNIKPDTLDRYISMSRQKLNQLDPKLDSTCEDDADNETSGSTSHLAVDESDETESSLEVSGSTFSVSELQPEDQDEELQTSLSSHGTLGELYPSMIRRIERAWDRQNTSVAADSVLRKYRRWRQSKRDDLNNTFDVTFRRTSSKPKGITSKALLQESSNSPGKKHLSRSEKVSQPCLQTVTNLYDGQVQQQSTGKERSMLNREHQHVRVMDFKPKKIPLNETFTVSQLSPPKPPYLGEHKSVFTHSHVHPRYAVAKASMDSCFKIREDSLSSHLAPTAMCSTFALETPAVEERPDIYRSPAKQSPFKVRMMSSLSRSPQTFSRSPIGDAVESCSRESVRPRSLSSPPERPVVQLRMLHPQDSQPQPNSPHWGRAGGGSHRPRRHLSFDATQPSNPVIYSPKKIDEDFMKLYHKFVCQNKSDYVNGPPCRLCARSSEASRGHSSSSLAALALSPHRSLLRKRHRELGRDSHPQSKRLKEEYCTHSPGSSRHRKQMRRRLSPFPMELPNSGVSYSPSKHRMLQPTAHQEAWMSQYRPAPDCSCLGGSHENKMANVYSSSWLR